MSQAETIGTAARTLRILRIDRRIGLAAGVLSALVAVAVAATALYMNYVPGDLDVSTSRLGEGGHYRVSYEPAADPIPVGELHAWTLTIVTPEGEPVEDAVITVDGDMPQHGHGLPTQPRMTEDLGDGRYLVEGVKFQMGGWWFVEFEVTAGDVRDRVRFDFVLP